MIQKTEKEIMKNWKGDVSKPVVSICCITYNHEKFIEDALDSFLMQETDFPFEIVIDDDCSTDNTPNIIKKYKEKFPNIINENLRNKNVGPNKNFIENLKRSKGEYIAICDGDDYWTDPLKLKKQVNFLEKNDEYGLVHTNIDWLINDSNTLIKEFKLKQIGYEFVPDDYESLLIKNFITTCSVCFRRSLINLESFFNEIINENFKMMDYPLWLEIARNSKIKYINEVTATRRVLEESASNTKSLDKKLAFLDSVKRVKYFFIKKYGCNEKTKDFIEINYYKEMFRIAFKYFDKELGKEAFVYLKRNKEYNLTIRDYIYYFALQYKFIYDILSLYKEFK
jgi:glycosyltransferase involved in cell wall biosynthesis